MIDRTYPLGEVPEAIGIWKKDTLKVKSSSPCEANLTGMMVYEEYRTFALCRSCMALFPDKPLPGS